MSGTSLTAGLVAITLRTVGSAINAGQIIEYQGDCRPGGMKWTPDTSNGLATKYLPKS